MEAELIEPDFCLGVNPCGVRVLRARCGMWWDDGEAVCE